MTEKKNRIFMHRNSESVHLKLTGDFDNLLVSELISILKKISGDVSRVIIHTSSLGVIDPFAKDCFQQNLSELGGAVIHNILFSGDNLINI